MKKRNAIFGFVFAIILGFGMASCESADSVEDISIDLNEQSDSGIDENGAGDPDKDRPGGN